MFKLSGVISRQHERALASADKVKKGENRLFRLRCMPLRPAVLNTVNETRALLGNAAVDPRALDARSIRPDPVRPDPVRPTLWSTVAPPVPPTQSSIPWVHSSTPIPSAAVAVVAEPHISSNQVQEMKLPHIQHKMGDAVLCVIIPQALHAKFGTVTVRCARFDGE